MNLRRTILIPGLLSAALVGVGCATAPQSPAGGKGEDAAFPLLINCGSAKSYTDSDGREWLRDRAYEEGGWGHVGGDTVSRGDIGVGDTKTEELFRTERWGLEAYRITAPKGEYRVILHFAETYEGVSGTGQRVFSVAIEGKTVLTDFDVLGQAGDARNRAISREFEVTVSDGVLDVTFSEKTQHAMVNAIEVVPKPKP